MVIDASGQDTIDVTAAQAVAALANGLRERGVTLFIAEMHEPVRAFLRDHGFLALPAGHDLLTVDAAVQAARVSSAAGTHLQAEG
jgi:hypothetical protein